MQDWTKRAASTTQWRERALRKQPWFRWRWGRDAPELICLAQLQPIQRQFPSCPLLHRRATVLQGLWKSILWSSPSCSCPHQSCQIFLVVETLLKCPAVYATKVLSPPLQRAFSPPCWGGSSNILVELPDRINAGLLRSALARYWSEWLIQAATAAASTSAAQHDWK